MWSHLSGPSWRTGESTWTLRWKMEHMNVWWFCLRDVWSLVLFMKISGWRYDNDVLSVVLTLLKHVDSQSSGCCMGFNPGHFTFSIVYSMSLSFQYARYLEKHSIDGVRNVFRRACTIHLPKKPNIHLAWAAFEERNGKDWDGINHFWLLTSYSNRTYR